MKLYKNTYGIPYNAFYSIAEKNDFNMTEKSMVHVITSGTKNSYNQIVHPEGMDATKYNGIVMFHHGPNDWLVGQPAPEILDYVIGKSLWQKQDGNNIVAKTQFNNRPFAMEVFDLTVNGFLPAWSIGFNVIKMNKIISEQDEVTYDILEWNLLEYSKVLIGANAEAVNDVLSQVKTDKMKSILTNEFHYLTIQKDYELLKTELETLKTSASNSGMKADEISKLITNELQKRDKILVEKLRGIVGNINSLDKLFKSGIQTAIKEAIPGAVREFMGKVD